MTNNLQSEANQSTYNQGFVYDFIIVGTGLVGATYARKLREGLKDATILMIDAGSQYSKLPGENAKNIYIYNYNEDGLDTLSNLVKA
jgi:choline dehydrogenase-like flavoprotein